MAKYKRYDYLQSVLLPVSLGEQLVPGTLEFAIHTLVDRRMDMSVFDDNYQNDDTGRSAYDPKILLKVVLLGYSRGLTSSRDIERACCENVLFMAMSCNQRPDHSTIAAFVSSMEDQIQSLFTDILIVCDQEGLLQEDIMATKVFVGVDVSKDNLDVAIGSEKQILTFANDQKGVDALIGKMSRIGPELIVFESTGGYERLAASLFIEAGLPVVIVNPRQVRDFAKSDGILAKTDAIDARVIARFAEAVKPDVRQLKDHQTSELTALVRVPRTFARKCTLSVGRYI